MNQKRPADVMEPVRYSLKDEGVRIAATGGQKGQGSKSGRPSLLWVLVKTYVLEFLVSVLYKVCCDLLDFANPLILK